MHLVDNRTEGNNFKEDSFKSFIKFGGFWKTITDYISMRKAKRQKYLCDSINLHKGVGDLISLFEVLGLLKCGAYMALRALFTVIK